MFSGACVVSVRSTLLGALAGVCVLDFPRALTPGSVPVTPPPARACNNANETPRVQDVYRSSCVMIGGCG